MLILRDMFWGALMWALTIGSVGGIIWGMECLVGPPISDRERTFTYILGGFTALGCVVFVCGVVAAVIYKRVG